MKDGERSTPRCRGRADSGALYNTETGENARKQTVKQDFSKNEEELRCQWIWLKGREIEKEIDGEGKMKS